MRGKLNYELAKLIGETRGGSYSTRRDRRYVLDLAARQLHEGGFVGLHATGLRRKHVVHLLQRWRSEVAPSTIENRLVHLRYWAKTIGKPEVVPSNEAVRRADREAATNGDRSRVAGLERVGDEYARMSLRLQEALGPPHTAGLCRDDRQRPGWLH